MNRNRLTLAGFAAGLVMAAACAPAMAQDGPPPPAAGDWKAHHDEHAGEKIHALHDLLNLRADQDAAFQTFVAAMRRPHDDGDHDHRGPSDDRAPAAPLTTPERLDRMAARMAKRQAQFQSRADATRRFYAVLSPEQQRAFDAIPVLEMDGHKAGPWGGDHGHGGWRHEGPGGPGAPPPPPAG